MKKNTYRNIIDLIKWLKYNKSFNLRMFYRQLKTRFFCRYFHNEWETLRHTHSAGKYIQAGYRCNKCNSVHYEFEINK